MTKTNNEKFSTDNNVFLTKSELDEFKKIALDDYGVKLTDEEALEQAIPLVAFFEAETCLPAGRARCRGLV